jgi:hypothetical protein
MVTFLLGRFRTFSCMSPCAAVPVEGKQDKKAGRLRRITDTSARGLTSLDAAAARVHV